MITNNEMQLKAKIKAIAGKTGITPQATLQMYCLERFLERISISKYHDYLIIKGGFLIASIIGIGNRSTMDIDATVKGFNVSHENVTDIFREICLIRVNDQLNFSFERIEDIREKDNYPGIRVFLSAIISRGIANTRTRDFYDIYTLYALKKNEINFDILKKALTTTARKRGTFKLLDKHQQILDNIKNDSVQADFWKRFIAQNPYARGLTFLQTISAIRDLLEQISL